MKAKTTQLKQINPIAPRANAKIVTVNSTRHILVGGMTADKVTNDIYELRSVVQDNNVKIQWKLLKFKNNVFKPRNSYSVCGSTNGKLYIWGGLQSTESEQKCLSDLIQVNIDTCQMRIMSLKQSIQIHSAALHFDQKQNQLLAIGGTNQASTLQSFLYTLKLDIGEQTQYQWQKVRLNSEHHKGYLWQHTSHLLNKSYFSGQSGKFLTVIGGCRYPQSPYSSIVQFDLQAMKQTNSKNMKYGLVSHDSIANQQRIIIFGGATGGDFNNNKIILCKGELTYEKGYNAVGCSVCQDDRGIYVIGGVCGIESLNSVIIQQKQNSKLDQSMQ